MLNETEKQSVMDEFPNIKLSYENIIYKKVYNADIYVATPIGKKCFAWFTIYNDRNVCFMMELNENKRVKNIRIVNACFSNELAYGTIFYGTFFTQSNGKFFSIEDIFSYRGKPVERENWGNKLLIIKDILKKDLKQLAYNNSFIVFGLPLMSNNIEDIMLQTKNVNYNIDCIQFRLFNRTNNYLFITYKNFIESPTQNYKKNFNKEPEVNLTQERTIVNKEIMITKEEKTMITKEEKTIGKEERTANKVSKVDRPSYRKEYIFKVKPDIQNDIYHLYCMNNEQKEEYYSVAYIPDYNCSVMMNSLFRNIKENVNLDALEESDDEEEFENERLDRFVYLDKSYNMVCCYNYKFKKFYPIKIAHDNSNIINAGQLKNIIN